MEATLYGWLLRALIALAKRKLADANKTCGKNWPAGQNWEDLGQSSKETFMSLAREEAGISTKDYRDFQKTHSSLVVNEDLDELWETGKLDK